MKAFSPILNPLKWYFVAISMQVPASWGKGGGGVGKGRGQHARSYLKKNPYIFAFKFPYSKMNFEYTASPSNFDIDNQTFMIPYTPPPHLFSRLDILIIFGRTFWYLPPPLTSHPTTFKADATCLLSWLQIHIWTCTYRIDQLSRRKKNQHSKLGRHTFSHTINYYVLYIIDTFKWPYRS